MTKKIALVARRDLLQVPGGDTLQMMETAARSSCAGTNAISFSRGSTRKASRYDLVHAFNMTRVHDTLTRCREFARAGIPIVVSPIHHALEWVNDYGVRGRIGIAGGVGRHLSQDRREALKAAWHAVREPSRFPDVLSMLALGYSRSQLEVLARARCVVCNSAAELRMLRHELGFAGVGFVSHLGLSSAFMKGLGTGSHEPPSEWESDLPYILSVGRVEPRKAQLDVIEAAGRLGYSVVLIRARSQISPGYYRRVREAARALPDSCT